MIIRILVLALAIIFGSHGLASAQTTSEVNANVTSSVSSTNSSVVTDLSALPADGISSVLITVTIVDAGNVALPQKEVVVSSNRGQVDTIRCYVGDTLTNDNITTTSASGIAKCTARSLAPGQATFSVTAEAVALDDKPTVTFTPLPVLQKLKVVVKLPGGGNLTIIEPAPLDEPSHESGDARLVDTGVNLQIPFVSFMTGLIILLLIPILFLIILILIRRYRRLLVALGKSNEQEKEWLAKIYQLEQVVAQKTTDIEQTAKDIEQKVDDNQRSDPLAPPIPPDNLPPPTTS